MNEGEREGADGLVEGVAERPPLRDALAAGERLLAEARATIADLDAAMNTAVNFALPASAVGDGTSGPPSVDPPPEPVTP